MTRRFRRLALVACALTVPLLTSGCAILKFAASGGVLGSPRQAVIICASGPIGPNSNYKCTEKGNSGLDATTGFRQLLLGVRIPAGVGAPATLVSQSPQSITFTSSPGYAAELQRLDPAPAGQRWVGWISPSLNYDTDTNTVDGQLAFVGADWKLPYAADGSPFSAGTITSHWVVGMRNVTQVATPDRPVACGDSLTTAFKDVDDANQSSIGFVYCLDSAFDITSGASDLGVVTSGARASGAPGSLVTLPFILRSGGADGGTTPLPVEVSTTLAGATATLPQATIRQPPRNGDTTAVVAVGIPAGAAPGTYGVTFTVDIGGQTRTGVGSLTVLPPPPVTGTGGGAGGGAGGGGGTITARKLTAVLLRGLTVADARAGGLPVLLGSTVAGPALVRLQQGPKKKPTVSIGKRIRLKSPGPVKVTFRSRKLVKGPYRISISVAGKVVKTAGGRLVK